jgi:aminopeptidase-like protein
MSKNQNNLLSNHIVANSDINKDNHGLILATIIERWLKSLDDILTFKSDYAV